MSRVCLFITMIVIPVFSNAQTIEEKLDNVLEQIEILRKNQQQLQLDVNRLKNAQSIPVIQQSEIRQSSIQPTPGKAETYSGGLAASVHPGQQIAAIAGTILIEAFPMDHDLFKKKFDMPQNAVTYNGGGELRVTTAGRHTFFVTVNSNADSDVLCKFSLDVGRDQIITAKKISLNKKRNSLAFEGSVSLPQSGAYKIRTHQYCTHHNDITWDLQMLSPGATTPLSLNSEYLFHLVQ